MARSIWSGAISFGLVSVPVKAFPAVRRHDVHFHQLDSKGARIRNQKISEKTGKPVDEIQLGYERSKGRYVTFDPDEIAELRPASTKTIDVSDFVDLAEIDPVYYDTTYWLAPARKEAAHAYSLLEAAMEDNQRVGIGTVVMRTKQRLAAIRPFDGALAMSTMRFADEIVPKTKVDGIPSRRPKISPKEATLATQIIEALRSDWDPARYHDTYTEELRDIIERRAKGEEVTVEEVAIPKSDVVDLMEALEASVAAAKGRSRPTKRTPKRASGGRSTTRSSRTRKSA
jgi:DNA end-binding protein Ku